MNKKILLYLSFLMLAAMLVIVVLTVVKTNNKKQAFEDQILAKNYITKNISTLSPEPEVLGGKFFVTEYNDIGPNRSIASYEDGHIMFTANVEYRIEDGKAQVASFEILEDPQADDNYIAWERIKNAIENCEVKSIMQAHSLAVSAELKDGTTLEAVEPEIDMIIDLAVQAEEKCGRIIMAIE